MILILDDLGKRNGDHMIANPVKGSIILWAKCRYCSHLKEIHEFRFWKKLRFIIKIIRTNLRFGVRYKCAQNLAVHSPTTCDLQKRNNEKELMLDSSSVATSCVWGQTFFGWSSMLARGGGAAFTEENVISWWFLGSETYFLFFFNYFLFLYFIPDAASKAALSTNPYWRFLTHSA